MPDKLRSLLGGSWDLQNTVISTLIVVVSIITKYSYLNLSSLLSPMSHEVGLGLRELRPGQPNRLR